MDKRFHSVTLDASRCKGCTKCLKKCPMEAIRVREGRAYILDERCIDCGECIRTCSYHAKVAMTDDFSIIEKYKYKIAIPAPSLYGQFNRIKNIATILEALKRIGFTEVYEVAKGADVVTRFVREKLKSGDYPRPLISSACPAVTRMIQLKFPTLIPNIINVRQPMEVAAMIAKKEFAKKHNANPEDIGVFFITPCAAKVTAIRNPIGQSKSEVDGAISIIDIYARLFPVLQNIEEVENKDIATPCGVAWANAGGETLAAKANRSLSVDGIENVMHVLEELENGKLSNLDYFEGAACPGGCVGGPLTYENQYVARNRVIHLTDKLKPIHISEAVPNSVLNSYNLELDEAICANNSMQLAGEVSSAIEKMEKINEITEKLPGYDCGSCGSPTCQSFAEDIVRGYYSMTDCIFILRDRLKVMAQQMVDMSNTKRE
ncbi:MAG: [Fe-Fe] hydrogenase large subunit C-terminal domain-containing protein [Eubacteriales bacterium]|nr:[Fe-Fe] hydrogenase large subunit C-terminal domain-containing protein [Eubacteriales bacterium]